jgi:hypothetical protein
LENPLDGLFPLFCRKYEEIYNEKTSEYLASFAGVFRVGFFKLQKSLPTQAKEDADSDDGVRTGLKRR